MSKIDHEGLMEGNLHDLTDDAYFKAIETCPAVLDCDGNPVEGLFADVVDLREAKRRGEL